MTLLNKILGAATSHQIFCWHGRYRDQGSVGVGLQGAKDCYCNNNHKQANG